MSKTVIVIGLSVAGRAVVQELQKKLPQDYRIVVIEAFNYAYWPVAALRGSIVPGWEESVVAPLTGVFPLGSRHVLLSGSSVVKLDVEAKVALLDACRREIGGGKEIKYDFVVIATGTDYGFPCRPPPEAKSINSAITSLKVFQTQVADAQDLLVIGAGPVGIEFCGELAAHYGKGKSLTLVGHADKLFSQPKWKDSLGTSIQKQLQDQGVRVVLGVRAETEGLKTGPVPKGTKVTLKNSEGHSETLEPDFVLLANGNKPNTSFLDLSFLAKTGRVETTETLSLPSARGAYAVGDAIDRDTKMAAAVLPQAKVVVKNIVAEIRGQRAVTKHKDSPAIIVVPVGPSGGAGQLFGLVIGRWLAAQLKSKKLFVSMFKANYPDKYPEHGGSWWPYVVAAAALGTSAYIRRDNIFDFVQKHLW